MKFSLPAKTYKRERHLVGAASSGVHTISAVVLNPSLYFKCLNLESKVAFHFLGVQGATRSILLHSHVMGVK